MFPLFHSSCLGTHVSRFGFFAFFLGARVPHSLVYGLFLLCFGTRASHHFCLRLRGSCSPFRSDSFLHLAFGARVLQLLAGLLDSSSLISYFLRLWSSCSPSFSLALIPLPFVLLSARPVSSFSFAFRPIPAAAFLFSTSTPSEAQFSQRIVRRQFGLFQFSMHL